jgi:hypothetical protein
MSGLRLRAAAPEDLQVISAHVQDALVPLADMAWLRNEARFVLALNRFRWEAAPDDVDGRPLYSRTHSLLSIASVRAVRWREFDASDRDAMLSLIGIQVQDGVLELCFAGGGQVRIEAEALAVFLEDVGEQWPTRNRPAHAD